MGVKRFEGGAEDGDFSPHVIHHEEESAEYGYHGSFAEGDPLDIRCRKDGEHGGREVRSELAGPSDEVDEGLSGLTTGKGSHHSTRVV